MGTNYYGRIIPTRERKEELKTAVDNNDIPTIEGLVNDIYGFPHHDYETDTYIYGRVHLGKRSAGWKFLWNPNIYRCPKCHLEERKKSDGAIIYHTVYDDPYRMFQIYEWSKEGISNFVRRVDVEIYDEDDNKLDKEEFLEMAFNWCLDGLDSDSYKEYDRYGSRCSSYVTEHLDRIGSKYSSRGIDFYSDGLRFSTNTDFA